MSSSRLPGKVLALLGEDTALGLLLRRLGRASELSEVVVATSEETSDDPIAQFAEAAGVAVVRGPLNDVLERFRLALAATRADAVVRVTADCPLLDPAVLDAVVRRWRETESAYVANTLPPLSFPDGMDVEVIAAAALARAAARAVAAADREHVTSYVRGRPTEFTMSGLWLTPRHEALRITLDTRADLRLLRKLVGDVGPDASLSRILEAFGLAPAVIVQGTS